MTTETLPPKLDPNDPRCRWQQDADGTWIMPALQQDFLEWLVSFPRSGSQAQWARDHNVDERTVRRWKKDPKFVKEWRAHAEELNLSIERVQEVLNNLYDTASTQQNASGVKAASLYLEYVGKFMPTKKVVVESDDLSGVSLDELARLASGDD